MTTYDSFLSSAVDAYKRSAKKLLLILFVLITFLLLFSFEDSLLLNWLTFPLGFAALICFGRWSADSSIAGQIKFHYARGLPPPRDPHQTASQTEQVIRDYGKVLGRAAGKTVVGNALPNSKLRIKQAIVAGIAATDDKEMKEYLLEAYLSLSAFQPVTEGLEERAEMFAIEERLILSGELTKLGLSP